MSNEGVPPASTKPIERLPGVLNREQRASPSSGPQTLSGDQVLGFKNQEKPPIMKDAEKIISTSTYSTLTEKEAKLSNKRAPTAQSISLDLLMEGHIRSYVDFFNLAVAPTPPHSAPAAQASASATSQSSKEQTAALTTAELSQLKHLLTRSEDSQRSGDVPSIYRAKMDNAVFFEQLGNRDLAISYFKEALASAKVMHHNRTAEIEAAFALGGVLEKAGQLVESLEYFEHSRSMSIDKDVQEFEIASSKSIVSSRMKIAELLEKRRNFADAIKHYTECISVIKTSTPNDERLLNEIHFRLGNAHKQHGDIETAVEYLQHYLEKCEEIGDKINAGRARTALAACNESSSNPTQATDYLEQFVSMTVEDSSQKNSLSQACKQLGVLYNKMEKFDKAVHYFDWHFRLEREATAVMAEVVGQTSAVGRNPDENNNYGLPHEAKNPGFAVAQVQVGLSKGNARMREFFLCVVEADSGTRAKPNAADRMRELLYWKSTRLPFFGPLDKPLQDARVEEGATNTVT